MGLVSHDQLRHDSQLHPTSLERELITSPANQESRKGPLPRQEGQAAIETGIAGYK